MREWKPIETAPKDGSKFLAFGMAVEGMPVIMWDDEKPRVPTCHIIHWRESWYDVDVEVGDGLFKKEKKLAHAYWAPDPQQFRPTHWMPLPEAPEKL